MKLNNIPITSLKLVGNPRKFKTNYKLDESAPRLYINDTDEISKILKLK